MKIIITETFVLKVEVARHGSFKSGDDSLGILTVNHLKLKKCWGFIYRNLII